MQEAVKQSSRDNIEPIRKAAWNAYEQIKKSPQPKLMFPLFCFNSNPAKQIAFTKIMYYQQRLFNHARALKNEGQECQPFRQMCVNLREQTFKACYADLEENKSKEQCTQALQQCRGEWQRQLATNQKTADRFVDKTLILDEIGVALSCFVVFYPIALGINYYLTKRVGFFCHSEASRVAEKAERKFGVLCN